MIRGQDIRRVYVAVRGAVQGVGFRPHVYRLASELGLNGWVVNSGTGVFVEVEGRGPDVERFLARIQDEKPPRAFVQSMEHWERDPCGYRGFEIRESREGDPVTTLVLPDLATCEDCRHDIFNPDDRRYLYPFTNCTNCGPRYSILRALPYDRVNTSMARFAMCEECRKEYEDPSDRRFHAQPIACPRCGPRLALWDAVGNVIASGHDALLRAVGAVREGRIVALKGLGGFQILVDALSEPAVRDLRRRKGREEKPFAVMAQNLEWVRETCEVSLVDQRTLTSPESPIVLLKRRPASSNPVAASIAPSNPCLGVMLPYTPLHHLFMAELGAPVVATSGNRSDEPICTDENEALHRLEGVADHFLVHDRPIVRHVDDSIVRFVAGREMMLRRARGYAPLPVPLGSPLTETLAVGAHLKNAVALAGGANAFVSQHVGDLDTRESCEAFQHTISSLSGLLTIDPGNVVADLHPDYRSTQYAMASGLHLERIQHHYAHVTSCMADNGLDGTVLGVSWDGTGLGTDGTIWGGEFLLTHGEGFERVGAFRTFPLPGGEQAIREPRRSALGLLYALRGEAIFDKVDPKFFDQFNAEELRVLSGMLARGVVAPLTSSVGRLFDGVAALLGIRSRSSFEGQAAMELEFAATESDDSYEFRLAPAASAVAVAQGAPTRFIVDWSPAIHAVIDEFRDGVPAGVIAARFHNTLAEVIVAGARHVAESRVCLTGGCFQNKYLTERSILRLTEEGFRPYWHQRVPPNDGGIALGQLYALVLRRERNEAGLLAVEEKH